MSVPVNGRRADRGAAGLSSVSLHRKRVSSCCQGGGAPEMAHGLRNTVSQARSCINRRRARPRVTVLASGC